MSGSHLDLRLNCIDGGILLRVVNCLLVERGVGTRRLVIASDGNIAQLDVDRRVIV